MSRDRTTHRTQGATVSYPSDRPAPGRVAELLGGGHFGTRCQGDDGSVIVEAAMVLPILLVLVAGVVDFGVGFRARLTMQSAIRTAGRIGAASKAAGNADQRILIGLNAGLASLPTTGPGSLALNQVAVFEAVPDGTGTQNVDVPANCTNAPSGSGSGQTVSGSSCNTYNAAQVSGAASSTSFTAAGATTCTATAWDRFWCPPTRDTALTDNSGNGPDYLGVWVKATYTPLTKVITQSVTMTDEVVVRLEPDA